MDKLLTKRTIQIIKGDDIDWKGAIRLAAQPLLDDQAIEPTYVESMINTVHQEGPYFNIGPRIALAHARPDAGVNRISLSLLKTDQPVDLVSDEHPINLWFVLAATDNQTHLSVIQALTNLLMDEQKVDDMCHAERVETLEQIVNNG